MGGSHGDRRFRVSRVVDRVGKSHLGRPNRGGDGPVSGVAGGGYDNHAGLDEAIHFCTDGTLSTGKHFRVKLVADAEIHAMDTQELRIVVEPLSDVVESADHVARTSVAISVQ